MKFEVVLGTGIVLIIICWLVNIIQMFYSGIIGVKLLGVLFPLFSPITVWL